MKIIDTNTWSRKQQFEHFKGFSDPYFAVTIPFNVSSAYDFAKSKRYSFFAKYLHDCIIAINSVENLKYRILNDQVVAYEVIHASATLIKDNNDFALSYIKYSRDLDEFVHNINKEKQRVQESGDFYPPENNLDCIHCSALPWVQFISNKEANSGEPDSVPKLAFSKVYNENGNKMMNVSIAANHALVDGYHIGQFADEFQRNLNRKEK